ncbi:thioredoxin domain-containing protein [Emcibacter sp. SYSU 3D8]|uniref:DsbA family protein n=1 Tax=Emcibacter sp. SYSU 3D8 TaxID=3133969 RepID=UPI0031FE94C8
MTHQQHLMSKVFRLPAALLLALGLSVAACGDGGAKAPEPAKAETADTAAPAAEDPANAKPIPGVPLDDMAEGSVDAPVTVIEFASMTCPHCAHFQQETFPLLKRDFIDTGKIRFIFREFPLDSYAVDASILVRCSGTENYFKVLNKLFAEQLQWMPAPGPISEVSREATQDRLAAYGEEFGVDEKKYQACLDNKPLKDHLANRMDEARERYKVNGTPAVVVNGKLAASSSYADVAQAIKDATPK